MNLCKMVPLITSSNCVKNLLSGKVDAIVLAYENSCAGKVEETELALKNLKLKMIAEFPVRIHHCLYKRKEDNLKDISCIISHIQALMQTANFIKTNFPDCKTCDEECTALSAKKLAFKKYGPNCMVICPEEIGNSFKDLELVAKNIEDETNNFTTFRVFEMNK